MVYITQAIEQDFCYLLYYMLFNGIWLDEIHTQNQVSSNNKFTDGLNSITELITIIIMDI